MKFKHEEAVKCTIEGVEIVDAKISIDKYGHIRICQNLKSGNNSTESSLEYRYSWLINNDFTTNWKVTDLRPAKKSFDYPRVGDEYKNRHGDSKWVLGVNGRIIHLSQADHKNKIGVEYLKEELIAHNFTIVQDQEEEIVEMTLKEVCEEIGRTVKIIK